MWIFTKYGFFSAVCARESAESRVVDPDMLMVRARQIQHLRDLQEHFTALQEFEIVNNEGTDYCCRMFVPKEVWKNIMVKLTNEMDYDNFKEEVGNSGGSSEYQEALGQVWRTMYFFQEGEAF